VPLFRSPSADLNFTIALALIAVVLSQYFGIRSLGSGYLKRFLDLGGFKNGALVGIAQAFAGFLEFLGEFTKIISFSFRLFGNVFAGEVLLAVMAFLIPYIASLPFYGLELFVGFIQAVVFMMLTLVFFVNASSAHGAEEHH
jgi:F-type H+-transporting ATPase subunit a